MTTSPPRGFPGRPPSRNEAGAEIRKWPPFLMVEVAARVAAAMRPALNAGNGGSANPHRLTCRDAAVRERYPARDHTRSALQLSRDEQTRWLGSR